MQLAHGPATPVADVAAALRVAGDRWGHRPAVTVLHPDRREEQGFASMAQWAAKGAHLLTLDLLLEPGDRVALAGPPGWLPAAVALAAWWAGLVVVPPGGPVASVAVVHEGAAVPAGVDDVLRWGDAPDGSPLGTVAGEAWPVAVQAFPDAPPTPAAGPGRAALWLGDTLDQAAVLARAASGGVDGTAGYRAPPDGGTGLGWLPGVAVRPLLAGRPTVVLDRVPDTAAEPERVVTWLA